MAEEQSRPGAQQDGRGRRSDRSWRGRRRARRRERDLRARARARAREERSSRRASQREAARRAASSTPVVPPPGAEPTESAPSSAPAGAERAPSRTQRRLAQRRDRRRDRTRTVGRATAVGLLVVAAAAAGVGLRLLASGADEAEAPVATSPDALPDGVDPQPTLLLVTAAEDADPRVADSLVVLAHDRLEQVSTILLLPAATVADVPGHGVLPLADALRFGGPALVAATVDNLLGIHLDAVADLTYRDWEGLFTRVGPVEVDIAERLVERNADGTGDVRFLAGRQLVDPAQSAELLALQVEGERELERLPRIQQVLLAHLRAMAADPALLEAVVADGLPMVDSELPGPEVAELLRVLADAAGGDRLEVRVLPVRPFGAAGEDGYRPDAARVDQLVADRFAASVPNADREGRSLQVLNGNGTPGIGQSVAEQLLPAGFRVVLTGNADDFDHERTRIVIYSDDPEQVAIANEIRELLGVGVIEVSRTPQSVVDVTIVVGRDYGR